MNDEKRTTPTELPKDGEIRDFEGVNRIYVLVGGADKPKYGQWVRHYEPPAADDYKAMRAFSKELRDRFFRYAERGINIPSERVDGLQEKYDNELEPNLKRAYGGMLLGALFNRSYEHAEEVYRLAEAREDFSSSARMCGSDYERAFMLEMALKPKRKGSAHDIDGIIDEDGVLKRMFGEMIKPVARLDERVQKKLKNGESGMGFVYHQRNQQIAQTMIAIDDVANVITQKNGPLDPHRLQLGGLSSLVIELKRAAKERAGVVRTDEDFLEINASFKALKSEIAEFEPDLTDLRSERRKGLVRDAVEHAKVGATLMVDMALVRLPRPRSVEQYVGQFAARGMER